LRHLSKLLRATSLGPAIVYGLAGIAFILATLMMSLALNADDFAEATLLLSISNLAAGAAPAGLNGITLRHDLRTDIRLLSVGAAVVVISAIATGVISHSAYGLDAIASLTLVVSVIAGGLAFLTLPKLQRAHRFMQASLVAQMAAFSVFLAALLMLAGVGRTPWFPIVVSTVGWILIGIISLPPTRNHAPTDVAASPRLWRQALDFWGIALVTELMAQLERLLIPFLLDRRAVGSFAVVAAVAIAPYRIVEMATATTMVARLRSAANLTERRRVFKREAMLLVPVGLGGGAVLLFAGLPIARYVRPEATDITYAVLAVGAFSGFCRVLASFSRSIASAFCSARELGWVNMGGWAAVAAGVLGAWALSSLGLIGVILGVALGWLLRAVITGAVCWRYLFHR
jgi:hypothetical protein